MWLFISSFLLWLWQWRLTMFTTTTVTMNATSTSDIPTPPHASSNDEGDGDYPNWLPRTMIQYPLKDPRPWRATVVSEVIQKCHHVPRQVWEVAMGTFCQVFQVTSTQVVKIYQPLKASGLNLAFFKEAQVYQAFTQVAPSLHQTLLDWSEPHICLCANKGLGTSFRLPVCKMTLWQVALSPVFRETHFLKQLPQIVDHLTSNLHVLHEHLGMLHRDIKPANILYDLKRKQSYLVDFGSCHFRQVGSLSRMAGWGTYSFCAPEALPLETQGVLQGVPQGVLQGVLQGVPQGSPQGVPQGSYGPEADVYALCASLWSCLLRVHSADNKFAPWFDIIKDIPAAELLRLTGLNAEQIGVLWHGVNPDPVERPTLKDLRRHFNLSPLESTPTTTTAMKEPFQLWSLEAITDKWTQRVSDWDETLKWYFVQYRAFGARSKKAPMDQTLIQWMCRLALAMFQVLPIESMGTPFCTDTDVVFIAASVLITYVWHDATESLTRYLQWWQQRLGQKVTADSLSALQHDVLACIMVTLPRLHYQTAFDVYE